MLPPRCVQKLHITRCMLTPVSFTKCPFNLLVKFTMTTTPQRGKNSNHNPNLEKETWKRLVLSNELKKIRARTRWQPQPPVVTLYPLCFFPLILYWSLVSSVCSWLLLLPRTFCLRRSNYQYHLEYFNAPAYHPSLLSSRPLAASSTSQHPLPWPFVALPHKDVAGFLHMTWSLFRCC